MAYDLGLAERVRDMLAPQAGFSEKKMFGGICFMIHGNMCCGVSRDRLMLRLSVDGAAAALERPHTRPMDFTRKAMKSMLFVDPGGTDLDEDLHGWVSSALAFVQTLPRKPARLS